MRYTKLENNLLGLKEGIKMAIANHIEKVRQGLREGKFTQASDRLYAIPSFSDQDSVYILEYPGYGSRKGVPQKLRSLFLRERRLNREVCNISFTRIFNGN
jgi:hypothetical protein